MPNKNIKRAVKKGTRYDRPAADGNLWPTVTDTESIVKAIHSPDTVSKSKIEMTQSLHRFVGGIGETRQRRRRRDDTRIVLHRPVRRVAIDRVAGRQSPAVLAVSFMPLRVLYAVGIIDFL